MTTADLDLGGITPDPGSIFYDRAGEKISFSRALELKKDLSYKIIARTAVSSGEVITAWLGSNQLEAAPAPLIFGTILRRDTVGPDGRFDYDLERLSPDESTARATHELLVAELASVPSDHSVS